jgi:hypothetical protein
MRTIPILALLCALVSTPASAIVITLLAAEPGTTHVIPDSPTAWIKMGFRDAGTLGTHYTTGDPTSPIFIRRDESTIYAEISSKGQTITMSLDVNTLAFEQTGNSTYIAPFFNATVDLETGVGFFIWSNLDINQIPTPDAGSPLLLLGLAAACLMVRKIPGHANRQPG